MLKSCNNLHAYDEGLVFKASEKLITTLKTVNRNIQNYENPNSRRIIKTVNDSNSKYYTKTANKEQYGSLLSFIKNNIEKQ